MKGQNPGWQAGNYWVVCDTCGFDYRVRETRLTWDNFLVCEKCWEPRHPQEYVRGIRDKQSVPIARPEPDTSMKSTTLSSSASKTAKVIYVADITQISENDPIGVTLNDDSTQWFQVDSLTVATKEIVLNEGLFYGADSGNKVSLAKLNGGSFLSTAITPSDL